MSSNKTISGGSLNGVTAGEPGLDETIVNISGGSIGHLDVNPDADSISLRGGEFLTISCMEKNASELLADGYSYWNQEGTITLNPEYDTDLNNVIVKATCLHPEEKLSYKDLGTGTHNTTCAEGHSGGKASCTAKAVCDFCGASYGTILDHNYTYTADEDANTITESCDKGCNHSKTLTLKAPENLVFDGYAHEATVEGSIYAEYDLTYSANPVSAGTDAGDYTIWYYVVGDSNHTDSAKASVDVSIAQKKLAVSLSGSAVKVYDETATVPSGHNLSITLDGVCDADEISASASFVFADSDLGTTTVNASNISLSGADSGNYYLATSSLSADVGAITGSPLSDFVHSFDSQNATVTLTKYIGTSTFPVVPKSYTVDGTTYNVVLDSASVFNGNTSILKLKIEGGVAWNAPVEFGAPVYRYFNPISGDHHYTMSAAEGADLLAAGWNYEGVAWNSASSEHLPIYRLYNPNTDIGAHHFTGSAEERDMLVDAGWIYEGIGWFALLY